MSKEKELWGIVGGVRTALGMRDVPTDDIPTEVARVVGERDAYQHVFDSLDAMAEAGGRVNPPTGPVLSRQDILDGKADGVISYLMRPRIVSYDSRVSPPPSVPRLTTSDFAKARKPLADAIYPTVLDCFLEAVGKKPAPGCPCPRRSR